MASKPNIRSIRFSDELAELIDRQVGNSFTEKFENLIQFLISLSTASPNAYTFVQNHPLRLGTAAEGGGAGAVGKKAETIKPSFMQRRLIVLQCCRPSGKT